MTAKENDIRDKLAERLELVESGLRHVANNYHVKSDSGADGYLDILARDSTGAFVVIELKKSTSTSRQALHEVGKYIDLLCRDKGLSSDQVRAMIVSTEWHELLVPFSYYVHQSDFDLQGYELLLASDGLTPEVVKAVPVLPKGQARMLTASQRRIDSENVEDLRQAWDGVKARLVDLGVADHVALHLGHESGSKKIVIALGTITSDIARRPMNDVLLGQDALEQVDLDALPTEELVLLGMEYEGQPLGVCYPEKVGSLVNAHEWTVDSIERAGVFEDADLFPDEDILDACQGWSGGLSDVHYAGRAKLTNKAQWQSFRAGIATVIADSVGWVAPTRLWLDELEVANPAWDISVTAYDQHDLLQSLLHGYRDERWPELVPWLTVAIEALDGTSYGLFGYLHWDGTVVDLVQGLRTAYANIGDWGDSRGFYFQAEANSKLLHAWHLRYVLTEKRAASEYPDVLEIEHGALARVEGSRTEFGDGLLRSLWMVDFLEAHEEQLDRLVEYLRSHVVVDPGSATQMHFFDGNVDSDWY